MQRAVDSDNITLRHHVFQIVNAAASDLLLRLRTQTLVVIVEQLLAVKRLQTTENALANTATANGANHFVFQVVLVLGHGGNVPVTAGNLLVRGDEVADQHEDGHQDVFGDRDDVAARHLGDGDTAVGLVGSIEVDVVGPDARSNRQLEVLCLGQTLSVEVSWMEPVASVSRCTPT